MQNFIFHIPVKYYFGKGQIVHLNELIKPYGNRILLCYGGGSIKKNGVYDAIMKCMKESHKEVIECNGIEANPDITTVEKGVRLAREKQIDLVIAAGGGSVIDCSKAIACGMYWNGDLWDMVMHPEQIQRALPIIAIPTAAATGSELNSTAVISNAALTMKKGFAADCAYPVAAIADPVYTFSVPVRQTRAGAADIMSHIMEDYFNQEAHDPIADGIAETLLKAVIHALPVVLKNPSDYQARADLLYASAIGIKSLTKYGKGGSWTCHAISHELTAFYGVNHGESLAVITPVWMRQVLSEQTVNRFAMFAEQVWNIHDPDLYKEAESGISALRTFWTQCGLPASLKELGIQDGSRFDEVVKETFRVKGFAQSYVPLNEADVKEILEQSLA